jgi:hypothetical protein
MLSKSPLLYPYSIFLSLLIIGAMVMTVASARAQNSREAAGEILKLQGEVWLDGKAAAEGALLYEGSRVQTKEGFATLLLKNEEGLVQLGKFSAFVVEQYADRPDGDTRALLNLKAGAMRTLLKKRPEGRQQFNLKSRNIVMGIRGTEVVILNPAEPSLAPTFAVIDGQAQVLSVNGASVLLRTMQKVVIDKTSLGLGMPSVVTPKEAAQFANQIPVAQASDAVSGSQPPGGGAGSLLPQHDRSMPNMPRANSSGVDIDVQW